MTEIFLFSFIVHEAFFPIRVCSCPLMGVNDHIDTNYDTSSGGPNLTDTIGVLLFRVVWCYFGNTRPHYGHAVALKRQQVEPEKGFLPAGVRQCYRFYSHRLELNNPGV